jgi:hypothetical protein
MVRARSFVGAAVAALALVSSPALAQAPNGGAMAPDERRGFENSWFWGAKAGVLRFGTTTEGYVTAPLAGGEWLVTRRRAALLIHAEQAFFDRTSAVFDAQAEDGARVVGIRDARRYGASLLAFPAELGPFRPYAGLGLAIEVIRAALPVGEFDDLGQMRAVADRIDAGQSRSAAYLVGGAQAQYGRVAVFVQGTASASQGRSLWNRGGTTQLEAGLRYNLSSAFDY